MMTQKQWIEMTYQEKMEYIYELGIKSTHSLAKGKSSDKEFLKIRNMEVLK